MATRSNYIYDKLDAYDFYALIWEGELTINFLIGPNRV